MMEQQQWLEQKMGLQVQFKDINSKMLYTHCYGHALNLAVKDMSTKVRPIKDCFDMAHEITKLVKDSPKRKTLLKQICEDSQSTSKSIHAFCPTRWTVRGETLMSFVNNHDALMQLWDTSLQMTLKTDMKARILGAQNTMRSFNYLFCCSLGQKVLGNTDNLSRALQSPNLSAVDGQNLAINTLRILKAERSEISFERLWSVSIQKQQDLDIEEPKLGRRKVPKNLDGRSISQGYHPLTTKDK